MADNYLITGYWGVPHVTAENDRGIHAGIFGAGRFVLPVGEQFKAEYIGNNIIRMYDGKLIDNGAAAGIPAGEYVDLVISNAGQNAKRNDLIVFQYSRDASTLIETGVFTVVQGTETTGTPADPVLAQEDLLAGNASQDQMALWRVAVNGTNIAAPVQMFDVSNSFGGITPAAIGAATAGHTHTAAAIGAAADDHTHTAEDVGAAEAEHEHSADDITSGLLPLERGGLGTSDPVAGRETLGIYYSETMPEPGNAGRLYFVPADAV